MKERMIVIKSINSNFKKFKDYRRNWMSSNNRRLN